MTRADLIDRLINIFKVTDRRDQKGHLPSRTERIETLLDELERDGLEIVRKAHP